VSTQGEMRRAQRRAAREDERARKTADVEPTPLEALISRKMTALAKQEAPPEHDARAVAKLIVRHWGDQAPDVAELVVEYVRDEVGRWTPRTPETADRGPSTPPEEGR
jgi:hypothetical protein